MITRKLPLILLALTLAATAALADDHVIKLDRQIVITDDADTETTVRLDDGRLQIVVGGPGEQAVHEFDLDRLGVIIDQAVGSAMSGLEEALDEDLTISVENGHLINVKQGDRACGFDARLLVREIQRSLGSIQNDIQRELGHRHGVHQDSERDEMAELEAELDRLKAELKSLRDDLDRVR
jgi:polyhydroxyalkanoate synthesis regulator phasin